MKYEYNESNDSFDCECGISVTINIPTNELTQIKLVKLIDQLELKAFDEYKEKYNIDLGLPSYYD